MPDTPLTPPQGQPHKVGWFWNLLGLHGRQSRPVAAYFDDLDGDEFTGGASRADSLARASALGVDRNRRYSIFDEMDSYGLVSAIIDTYAEEATQRDYDRGVSVWIESKAAHMVQAGKECLHNCQVEDRITPIVRSMVKYGDRYQRLLYATGKGVLGWRMTPAKEVTRIEDKYNRLVGFQQNGKKFRAGQRETSWPWDFVHFRMLGKDEETGYGTSLLHNLFQPWRRMALTEEAIFMFRLRRMPDRNVIMVNCGNMAEADAMAFVNAWRKKFRKYEFVDPASPNYRKEYNPLTPLEDIFVPMIEGREHRIEPLAGAGNVGEIYDLEHFRDAFFGAAKVPKAYFGFEGDVNAKATLIQQDMRFAHAVKRVQRAGIYGLRQMLDVHYTLLSDGTNTDKFDIKRPENAYIVQMAPVSYLDESDRLELVVLRNSVVDSMASQGTTLQLDPRMWATYILLNYAKIPEETVLKLIKQTPDEPPAPIAGAGPGFEALSPTKRAEILDRKNDMRKGFYPLSESEKLAIANAVHNSPRLRRSISHWAEWAQEELLTEAAQQTDSSLTPPVIRGTLSDEVDDSSVVKELVEDLRVLSAKGA